MKCPACGADNADEAAACGLCQAVFAPRPASAAGGKPAIDYARVAAQLVERSKANDPFLGGFGVVLDYSPASVFAIDRFTEDTWGVEGESPDKDYAPSKGKANVIMEFGSYFGEVALKLFGGAWEPHPQQPDNPLQTALALAGGSRIFPIAKAYKRFKNGAEDALGPFLFYLMRQFKIDGRTAAESFVRQAEAFLNKSALPPGRKLALAREFADLAKSLHPELDSPSLAAILATIAKADPKDLDPAPAEVPGALIKNTKDGQEAALTVVPNEPAAPAEQGWAFVRLRRFDEALAEFSRAESAEAWDGRGAALFGKGRIPEALAACERALALDPKLVAAHARRGDLLRALGKAPEALASYEQALALDKDCAPAMLAESELLIELDRGEEALALLKQVLNASKQTSQVWHRVGLCVDRKAAMTPEHKSDPCRGARLIDYFKARCCDRLGDFRQAGICYRSMIEHPPAGHEAEVEDAKTRLAVMKAFEAALDLIGGENIEAFIAAAAAALALEPSRLDMRREMGVGFAMLGRYDEALKALDENLARDPNHKVTIANKGTVLSKMPGRLEDAIAMYDLAMRLSPGDRSSWLNKARCLLQLKQPERVSRYLDETLAADPEHELAWNMKGFNELKEGKNAEALASLKKFVEFSKPETQVKHIIEAQYEIWKLENPGRILKPEEAAPHVQAAQRCLRTGQFAQAVPHLEQALKFFHLDPDSWQNLGSILAAGGDPEAALKCVVWACDIDPRNEACWRMRAQLLCDVGRREEAAAAWDRVVKLWPKNADHWVGRGWNLNLLRRLDEAVASFDAALRLKPKDGETALRRAAVLDRAGKREEALAALRAAQADADFLGQLREKGEGEFGYLLCRESSPAFVEQFKLAFRA